MEEELCKALSKMNVPIPSTDSVQGTKPPLSISNSGFQEVYLIEHRISLFNLCCANRDCIVILKTEVAVALISMT